MARLRRVLDDWLRTRPGLPTGLLGAVYATFGLVHLWQVASPLLIDWIAVGLFELLAVWIVYGGVQITKRDIGPAEGLRICGATVGFGFIGYAVAAVLITLQLTKGAPLEEPVFAMGMASVTTAAIGIGLALYYSDLRSQRATLAGQHRTVTELNKRLTILHRVLRHNLRNELTIIQGHAELLLARDPNPDVEQSLVTLVEHADNVESLSENAYRLRQVWAEDAVVDQEVAELVETCVRETQASYPDVAVNADIPTRAVARAHPRLKIAVTEALENAVVHNDPETLEITVSVRQLPDPESAVEITVVDTGCGIPEFEPDVLEQVEERPLHHATGLGLWLIYWVVEQSGGELRFEENDPQGTVVRMRLPAVAD